MQTTQRSTHQITWSALVRTAAAADLLLVLAVALSAREVDAVVIAAGFGAGLLLLGSANRRIGRFVLGLSFANTEVWMLPAAASGVVHHDAVTGLIVSCGLAVSSLVGLIAVVADADSRGSGPVPTRVAGTAVAVLAGALLVGVLPVGHRAVTSAGDLRLSIRDTRYSTTHLTARAGEVSVRVTNHDLFWHTFTVAGTGIDLKVPVGGTRSATFGLKAGVYRYYCRIPGHRQAGMQGTIVVQ